MSTKKKIGRPTTNPKNSRITVRLDEETNKILKEYSQKHKIDKASAVREGIKKLKE